MLLRISLNSHFVVEPKDIHPSLCLSGMQDEELVFKP